LGDYTTRVNPQNNTRLERNEMACSSASYDILRYAEGINCYYV